LSAKTETTQGYFYDPVGTPPREAQVALFAKGSRSDYEPVLMKKHEKWRASTAKNLCSIHTTT
jgi:hypothetical protein